jgi:hypothetical protein
MRIIDMGIHFFKADLLSGIFPTLPRYEQAWRAIPSLKPLLTHPMAQIKKTALVEISGRKYY